MEKVLFQREELNPKGYFSSSNGEKVPIFNTPITPRENYKRALRGDDALWVPMFSDCKKFMSPIFPDNVAKGMVICAEGFDRNHYTGGVDMFGIEWEYVPAAGGSTVHPGHPFIRDAEELITKPQWPDPDSWDFAGTAANNKEFLRTDLMLNSTILTGFFERLISFMDFENAAVALIDEDSKEYVHLFFERLTCLYEKMICKMKQYFHLDAIEFHDDWGSQRAPLFSDETLEEMILPYLTRVVQCVHDNEMFFELHSCGNHPQHSPYMIRAGVDCWAPQETANDSVAIFKEFGNRITIGISCPLPPGSPEEDYRIWARQFVDECVTINSKRLPVFHDRRQPACVRQMVYEFSRKKLCGS